MAARIEPWSLRKPNLLIVEGYSDLHFLAEFLEHLGNHTNTDIYQVGGKPNLRRMVSGLLTPATLEVARFVGVVLDADQNASGAFTGVRDLLQQCVGVTVVSPCAWTPTQPSYGIFVCPDGTRAGELETAAWEAWSTRPEHARQAECISAYLDCMERSGAELKSPDKVRVGAMLAVHNEDDPRIGPGARRRIFDFNSPALAPLRHFLAPLAGPPAAEDKQ